MKAKVNVKMLVDICLLLLLPVLMAELLTGQEIHEWLGTATAILFIFHHLLNLNWLKNIGRGNFTLLRGFMTALNLLMLTDMLALMISGIMMSGFVFEWLPVSGRMILSRRLHLFASYWGFILMAIHCGIHWNMAVRVGTKLRTNKESGDVLTWLSRGLAAAAAVFGIYAFAEQNIVDYLFLKSVFVYWDEKKSPVLFLAETVAMMGLFIAVGYYAQKLLKGWKGKK